VEQTAPCGQDSFLAASIIQSNRQPRDARPRAMRTRYEQDQVLGSETPAWFWLCA
jgi:hypothetical protein